MTADSRNSKTRILDGKGIFFIVIFLIVLADQITKQIAVLFLENKIILIKGFLDLVLVRNYGAGFGILQEQRLLLILIPIIVIIVIFLNYKNFAKSQLSFYGFALVTAGAIGNLIDRIIFGYVIDFINFSFWPTLNFADSVISIGAFLIILSLIKNEKVIKNKQKKIKLINK